MSKWLSPIVIGALMLSACKPSVKEKEIDPTPTPSPVTEVSPTPTAEVTPTPTPTPAIPSEAPEPVVDVVTIHLSGQVAQSLSGTQPVDKALVRVRVQDSDPKNGNAVRTRDFVADTDEQGRYQLMISDFARTSPNALIAVSAYKSGMTEAHRNLQQFAQAEVQLLAADLVMSPESQAIETVPDEGNVAIGSSEQVLRFGLYRDQSGQAMLMAGDQVQAMASAGQQPEVAIELPVSSLDQRVRVVQAGVQGFTPSDPDQAQLFPGDFIGRGNETVDETAEDAVVSFDEPPSENAEDEYRLISTAFAQVRLQDQEGEQLSLSLPGADQAMSSSASRPAVYMRVASDSLPTITADRMPDQPGIQVPIYLFRDGHWDFAGDATLMTWASEGYQVLDAALPLSDRHDIYARLEVAQGKEWVTWLNIDWPVRILNDEDVQQTRYCFAGNLQYAGTAELGPEEFVGYLDLSMPDGSRTTSFVANGQFQLSGVLNGEHSFPAGWSMTVVNRLLGQRVAVTLPTAMPDTSDCQPLPVQYLTNPMQCTLYGQVTRGADPVPRQLLQVSGQEFWRQVRSDANGNYRLNIPCQEDLELKRSSRDPAPMSFKADGVTVSPEGKDESAQFGHRVLLDVSMENQPPVISGVDGPRQITLASGESERQVDFRVTAYDVDSEALTLDWSCHHSETEPAAVATRVELDEMKSCQVTEPGIYHWTATVSDGDKEDSRSGSLVVHSAAVNRPPRLAFLQREDVAVSCSQVNAPDHDYVCDDSLRFLNEVTYRVTAFDPDGDKLTYRWTKQTPVKEITGAKEALTLSLTGGQGGQHYLLTITDQPEDEQDEPVPDPASIRVLLNINEVSNQAPRIRQFGLLAAPADMVNGLLPSINQGNAIVNRDALKILVIATDDFDPASQLTYSLRLTAPDRHSQSLPGEYSAAEGGHLTTLAAGALQAGVEYTLELSVRDRQQATSALRTLRLSVNPAAPSDGGGTVIIFD